MIQRIYIDTSVIGGCFDIEFKEWSNLLFEEPRWSGYAFVKICNLVVRVRDFQSSAIYQTI
jgi:hypothetical protein